jgi:hypothetical protein
MGVAHSSIMVLLSLLGLPGLSSNVPVDSDKRVVLVESPNNRLSKDGREHLLSAMGEVVTRHGLTFTPPDTLSDRLRRCEPQECLPQIAAASGAGLVLWVEAKYGRESFELRVELWDSDRGKLLGRDERTCPICDEQDLWGSAALLVQRLLDRAVRESNPIGPQGGAPIAELTQPPVQGPPTVAARPEHRNGNLARYGGLALVVAGASLLGTGIYLLAVDGRPACDRCDWDRDTAKYGRPMAIGGGLAFAGGVGLLLWGLGPSVPAVGLGPSGIFVAGRFR